MSSQTIVAFDYAIKYLLRDKGDYEIVEGFISALLTSEGYPPVKIKALLESESNREESAMKKSIADVVVEDAEGNRYIVEIERQFTDLFMNKACFNSSRLIVDSISSGTDFSLIKKVFHISLLYFTYGHLKAPLYHGKTIIREIDREHPLDLHLMDLHFKQFDSYNIFPEYFFISVPLFNDIITKEIDEWLYVIKHSEVKEDFKSPYMQKIAQKLSILKMSDSERNDYFRYMKDVNTKQTSNEAAMKQGQEEGELRKALNIAKKMLIEKMDIEAIAKFTELTIEQIEELKKHQ